MAVAVGIRAWMSRDVPAEGAFRTYDLGVILVEFEKRQRVEVTVTNKSGHQLAIPREPRWYMFTDWGRTDAGDEALLRLEDLVTLEPGASHVSPWHEEILPKFAWLPIERYDRTVRESTRESRLFSLSQQRLR